MAHLVYTEAVLDFSGYAMQQHTILPPLSAFTVDESDGGSEATGQKHLE